MADDADTAYNGPYHSEWHAIWVAATAARERYRNVPAWRRALGLAPPTQTYLSRKYYIGRWITAKRNGETCSECEGRPTLFKGKPLF